MTPILKKSIFISVCWHLAVLYTFSFTFGGRVLRAGFGDISFLGPLLSNRDLRTYSFSPAPAAPPPAKKIFNNAVFKTSTLNRLDKEYYQAIKHYLKPSVSLSFPQEKLIFMGQASTSSFRQRETPPVIMLYPPLPYHFLLYFKDRQSAHIELMFKIVSKGRTNTIMIKRKISSGNLEADLLSMRYISHYLFIQQAGFPVNNWQTVRIDLSAKERTP
jgi:hypothetical protein